MYVNIVAVIMIVMMLAVQRKPIHESLCDEHEEDECKFHHDTNEANVIAGIHEIYTGYRYGIYYPKLMIIYGCVEYG